MPSAADKYSHAIELYASTDMTLDEIARQCGVTRKGLSAYICRRHRDLMFRRNGLSGDPQTAPRHSKGQRPETRQKYREAIEACDSIDHIDLNISEIARLFNLDGTALANQLRSHYPHILPRREALRRKLGIADNTPRGPRQSATDTYADAVRLLRETDMTIEEIAEKCDVSYTGLRQHIIFYHKDLAKLRDKKRRQAKKNPKIGALSGNGRRHESSDETRRRYAEGVELYRTTSLPATEIAARIGVNINTFRDHLRTWHLPLILERRKSARHSKM